MTKCKKRSREALKNKTKQKTVNTSIEFNSKDNVQLL